MDGKGVDAQVTGFPLTANARGMATIWLRSNCPDASEQEIVSLATMLEMIWDQSWKKTMEGMLGKCKEMPTLSALESHIELSLREHEASEKISHGD